VRKLPYHAGRAALVVVLLGSGCGAPGATPSERDSETGSGLRCAIAPNPVPRPIACRLSGAVSEIRPTDPSATPSSFTLATSEGGVEILLDVDRDYGFPLGHLREHQRTADPVDVLVETQQGALVALSIEDAVSI
jgi:hypothetical protein